ncbi:MAG: ABC transporter permease [Thermoanaerobaculia bacterium]|nr:ABC transporter permease [Thermoanaerobaculia bacterium]
MWLSQIFAVLALNLRNLRQRVGSSVVAIVGIAGVVAILVAVLSIGEGFRSTIDGTAASDGAIILRSGSSSEMMSNLAREDSRIISDAPGVLRTADGPAVSPELFVVVDLPKKSSGTDANVPLRGVEPSGFLVRPEVKIVEGRSFTPGTMEVIAGRGAAEVFAGLTIGSELRWGQNTWRVVGIFTADGSLSESELWCDLRVLQPAYRRGDSIQSVYAKLESPAAFQRFADTLDTDPRLNVAVQRETDYYAAQSTWLSTTVTILAGVIALVMGIGAVFGALNTMYTAVSSRSREIATLRALGFGSGPVVISVLAEALLLGLIGGILGSVLAYAAFHGFQTSTLNWQSFSQVTFAFAVTPSLFVRGIFYALLIGLVGGLFPALRAARLPVAVALREL